MLFNPTSSSSEPSNQDLMYMSISCIFFLNCCADLDWLNKLFYSVGPIAEYIKIVINNF